MSHANNTFAADDRSLPWAGIIGSAIGCGLLFAYWQFSSFSSGWGGLRKAVFLTVAAALVLWGIGNGAFGRRGRVGLQLSRNRVLLPKQGMMYLVIMAVLFVGSLLGRTNMLMLVFAMMVGPFVLNGWITFSMLKRIGIVRRVPRRAMAGDPVSVEIELVNEKHLLSAWLMTVTDHIENRRERLDANVVFARIPTHARRSADYQLRPMQRGRHSFGPIQVATRFPLGLVERGLVFNHFDEMIVHPRLGRLSPSWKREHLLAAELAYRRQLRRGVFDDEFQGIREFRWGDNPRAIHWRTSARHNQVMVREFHQSRDQDLVVLLDLWEPLTAGPPARDRVEVAVSLAASICVAQMRQSRDCRVDLLVSGRKFTAWEGGSGPAGIESLLDALALVEASPDPAVDRLADEARARNTPNASLILISTRETAEAGRPTPRPEATPAPLALARETETSRSNGEPDPVMPQSALGDRQHGRRQQVSPTERLWTSFHWLRETGGRFQFIEADPRSVASFFQLD